MMRRRTLDGLDHVVDPLLFALHINDLQSILGIQTDNNLAAIAAAFGLRFLNSIEKTFLGYSSACCERTSSGSGLLALEELGDSSSDDMAVPVMCGACVRIGADTHSATSAHQSKRSRTKTHVSSKSCLC
jgi:hypothetical protein